MKQKQFESVCKRLLPRLPGFACRGRLLHAEPVGHVLRGFWCDDSSFDPEKFAVTVFYLPLYVPAKHLHFNLGHRLKDESGCDIWWDINDPRLSDELLNHIQRHGLPFLTGLDQPRKVATAVHQLAAGLDPYRLEAVAYSLAMAEDSPAAQDALSRLVKSLDRNIPWQAEMMDRAKLLARKLSSDPQEAKQQLVQWQQGSVTTLGLE